VIWLNIGLSSKITKICTTPFWFTPKSGIAFPKRAVLFSVCAPLHVLKICNLTVNSNAREKFLHVIYESYTSAHICKHICVTYMGPIQVAHRKPYMTHICPCIYVEKISHICAIYVAHICYTFFTHMQILYMRHICSILYANF